MNLATLILFAIRTSIVLTVFCLGLKASMREATYLIHRPGLLARSLLSMNIVMPLVTAALLAAFDLHPAVKIALMALAVSPVPPLLPKKALKAGGEGAYTISLLVTAGLLAVVFVPIAVNVLGDVFGTSVHVPALLIIKAVGVTIVLPLLVGMVVSQSAPAFADKVARPLSLFATVLLVVSAIPILFTTRQAIVSLIGNGTLAAMLAFVLAGLLAGYLLGGPDGSDRTVLALSSASRHPAIAMAVATATFPEQKLAPAAVALYLIVNAVVCLPYSAWSRRRHIQSPAALQS